MADNNKDGCLSEIFAGIGLIILIIGIILSLTGVGAIAGVPLAGVGYAFSYMAKLTAKGGAQGFLGIVLFIIMFGAIVIIGSLALGL